MGEVKNLTDQEAIEKMRELAEGADICMFTTALTKLPLHSRPMSTQEVDEQGAIWFMSRKTSNKNSDIQSDSRVQLFYASRNSSEYLSVYGKAEIIVDENKAKELWQPIARAWFEGYDDPELTLLKVTPEDSYYWDTKSNKVVSLLKIATAAITGKESDDGVYGKLKI